MFCTKCGYDLKGTPGGPCPECGYFGPGGELRRDGKVLYVPAGAMLPDFCVKCNEPAVGNPKKVKLSWHPPALMLLLLAGLLPYAIVALIMTKKATILVPNCARHRSSWTPVALFGLVLTLLAIGAFVALLVLESNAPNGKGPMQAAVDSGACFLIPVAGLAGIIMLNFGVRKLSPQRIDEHGNAWVKGVCPAYLDQHAAEGAPTA
jgi:hypothetical protein